MSQTRTEPENIILFSRPLANILSQDSWRSIATWGRELPQSKFEKVKRTTNEEKNKDVWYKEGSSSLLRIMFFYYFFIFVVFIFVVIVDNQENKDVKYMEGFFSLPRPIFVIFIFIFIIIVIFIVVFVDNQEIGCV